MPNHYDIDIWCKKCGAYITTIYPGEEKKIKDRVCDSCKKNKEVLRKKM